MVGHHHRPAGERFGQFVLEPLPGLDVDPDEILRHHLAVVASPDRPEIGHRRARIPGRQGLVARSDAQVRPGRETKQAYIAENRLVAIRDHEAIIVECRHFQQGAMEVPTKIAVVARNIEGRDAKCLPCPFDTPRAQPDVASQYHDIRAVGRRVGRVRSEFGVEVGQDVDAHGVSEALLHVSQNP